MQLAAARLGSGQAAGCSQQQPPNAVQQSAATADATPAHRVDAGAGLACAQCGPGKADLHLHPPPLIKGHACGSRWAAAPAAVQVRHSSTGSGAGEAAHGNAGSRMGISCYPRSSQRADGGCAWAPTTAATDAAAAVCARGAPSTAAFATLPVRTLLLKEVPQALDQLALFGLALGQQLWRGRQGARAAAAHRQPTPRGRLSHGCLLPLVSLELRRAAGRGGGSGGRVNKRCGRRRRGRRRSRRAAGRRRGWVPGTHCSGAGAGRWPADQPRLEADAPLCGLVRLHKGRGDQEGDWPPGGRLAAAAAACIGYYAGCTTATGRRRPENHAHQRPPAPPSSAAKSTPRLGLIRWAECAAARIRRPAKDPPGRHRGHSAAAGRLQPLAFASAPSHPPLASHCQWAGYNVQIAGNEMDGHRMVPL